MKIAYIIFLLIMFVAFILLKKSDKKQNVLFWIVISATLLMIYNIIETYILTLINIKSTLLALTIFNILVTIGIAIKIIVFDKEIQKYYIKITDIIFLVLLIVLIGVIGYTQYGKLDRIKYETTDPGVHYEAAKNYYEQKVLLFKGEKTSHYGFTEFMPAAYVNTGLMMNLAEDFINSVDMYRVYIAFDLIVLYLMGATVYMAITSYKGTILSTIVAMGLSFIYVMGYPLDSMLWGFAYLSVGILIITALIATAKFATDKDIKLSTTVTVLFMLMFGVFFSYYYFVPVVYAALGLYILFDIIKNRKERKFFSKENIIKVIFILALPTIIGFIYFILPGMIHGGKTSVSSLSHEGYIYRELYINFVPFVPFMLYYMIHAIKNKENDFHTLLGILLIAFVFVTFIGGMKGKVSSYYFFKSYFVLWILAFYMTYITLCKITENNKDAGIFVYASIATYFLICGIFYTKIDGAISEKNILFNPQGKSATMLDVQYINCTFMNRTDTILSKEQIEGIKYINEIIPEEEKTTNAIVYGDMLQRIWAYVLTGITDSHDLNSLYECPIETIDDFMNSDKKYLLCVQDILSDLEIDEESEDYKVLFNNGYSIVLEKND